MSGPFSIRHSGLSDLGLRLTQELVTRYYDGFALNDGKRIEGATSSFLIQREMEKESLGD